MRDIIMKAGTRRQTDEDKQQIPEPTRTTQEKIYL